MKKYKKKELQVYIISKKKDKLKVFYSLKNLKFKINLKKHNFKMYF